MDDQKCQVMVWEMDRTYVEGHDSSETMGDSHPDLDDRFIPIQRVVGGLWYVTESRPPVFSVRQQNTGEIKILSKYPLQEFFFQ